MELHFNPDRSSLVVGTLGLLYGRLNDFGHRLTNEVGHDWSVGRSVSMMQLAGATVHLMFSKKEG